MSDRTEPTPDGVETNWAMTFFRSNWPYLAMLALALGGVAFSSVGPGRLIGYWEILVPIFGLISWRAQGKSENARDFFNSARIDALHWFAVFLSMRLLMLPELSQMLNADAVALMLMVVLALGTFTAGNQVGSWKISLVGFLLALSVPAIAWMERSVLLLFIAVAAAVSVFLVYRWRGKPDSFQE